MACVANCSGQATFSVLFSAFEQRILAASGIHAAGNTSAAGDGSACAYHFDNFPGADF